MRNYSKKFTLRELKIGLNNLKPGKAAGYDKVFPEFLLNCGLRAKKWLVTCFNSIANTGSIPPIFKKSTVIALLKPGKDGSDPSHFRRISLLCVPYKLMERLILERIQLKSIALFQLSNLDLEEIEVATSRTWSFLLM